MSKIIYKKFSSYKQVVLNDKRFQSPVHPIADGRNHYVYRITNIKLNTHYYGSRVTKLDPNADLGIKYFSSSTVKEFLIEQKEYPKNFRYKIIKIFDNAADNIIYESYLHQYFNVSLNVNFINKSIQSPFGWTTTGNQEVINKTKNTKSIIQKSGLTIYQEAGMKVKETNSRIDQKTGLSIYKQNGIQGSKTRNKVQPCGLSINDINNINQSIAKNTIQESGLTLAQESAIKAKITTSKIQKSGYTRAKEISMKAAKTMKTIDKKTNMSIYQTNGKKISKTLNTIQESGLTLAQESGLKCSETKNTIQESGLTLAQESAIKAAYTMKCKNNSTGKSIYEMNGEKQCGTNHHSFKGYYIVNGNKYIKAGDVPNIPACSISKWCKNSDIIVPKRSYAKSKYLQSIGTQKEITSKTYKELGFDFIRLK